MPILRYSLQIKGESYTLDEEDTFAPTSETPEQLINREVLTKLQQDRKKLGEPEIQLLNVKIVNPFVHLHTWKKGRRDAFALKQHYFCDRCQITGFKKINIVTGEYGGIVRDEEYHCDRNYYLCKDPLKQLPNKLNF